jgi:hypothetical protein
VDEYDPDNEDNYEEDECDDPDFEEFPYNIL